MVTVFWMELDDVTDGGCKQAHLLDTQARATKKAKKIILEKNSIY